mmetsp:Transcript_38881/g.67262  ORF Transcript_38881/g.67262 Transcript_38881/m.67262 type:complete len:202 (+) Transcript_38881:628-1233(+)
MYLVALSKGISARRGLALSSCLVACGAPINVTARSRMQRSVGSPFTVNSVLEMVSRGSAASSMSVASGVRIFEVFLLGAFAAASAPTSNVASLHNRPGNRHTVASAELVGDMCCVVSISGAPNRTILCTAILFSVSVPVLSEQITLTLPRVSTAGRDFTIALEPAMTLTPMAKVTVMQEGRPSGMAATATPMAMFSDSSTL